MNLMIKCRNKNHKKNDSEIQNVRFTAIYNFDLSLWCVECQERDSDKILHNFRF